MSRQCRAVSGKVRAGHVRFAPAYKTRGEMLYGKEQITLLMKLQTP